MNKLHQIKNLLGDARDALQAQKYNKAQKQLENAIQSVEIMLEIGDHSNRKELSPEAQIILDEKTQ